MRAVAIFLAVIGGLGGKSRGDDTLALNTIEILLKLYDDTRGMRWEVNDDWLTNPNFCEWHGITCYSDDGEEDDAKVGQVRNIELNENSLVGTIPDQIFDLPYLHSLDIRGNADVTMRFSNIGSASYLEFIGLDKTGVKSLDSIGDAPKLKRLHISELNLAGTLPEEIFRLTGLQNLYASYNLFTGTLSTRIGELRELKDLFLYTNGLQGQIPSEIRELKHVRILALGNNLFSGTLPPEIDQMERIEVLAIPREEHSTGGIHGSLPALASLRDLTEVYLDNHFLTGTIPSNFLESSPRDDEVTVFLSNNLLTGKVPASLDEFTRLKLFIADNQITSLPDSFCDNDDWMGGDVGRHGCAGIACPAGTFNVKGRQTSDALKCENCPGYDAASSVDGVTRFMGMTYCPGINGTLPQRHILTKFYNAMEGNSWTNREGWKEDGVDECDWHGITCNNEGEVTGVSLPDNNLGGGPPPKALFKLPELTTIDLSENSIEFEFGGFERASKLQSLSIANIGLTSIEHIGRLSSTSIESLRMYSNSIDGSIPDEFFNITSLRYVSMSHNALEGTLSSDIGQLTNLREFYVYGNYMSGTIPTTIGLLTELKELVLSENNFVGTIPTEIDQLVNLEEISIHQNTKTGVDGLTGTLPAFESLVKLSVLHLDSNALTGPLPASLLANSERLDERLDIDLRNNRFEGTVPSEWRRFENLDLWLSENLITGISPDLCDMNEWMEGEVESYGCDAILCPTKTYNFVGRSSKSSQCIQCEFSDEANYLGSTECQVKLDPSSDRAILERLFYALSGRDWTNSEGWVNSEDICNDWYGITCNNDGEVTKLILADNGISGTPPTEIFKLKSLKELNLQNNVNLTFSFVGIEHAASLDVLYLSNTGLESIEGIGYAPNLRELHITSNGITGTIPEELFGVTSLRRLFMNFNKFSGRLSPSIGNLEHLEELYLVSNRLTGQLPAAIGNLKKLERVGFSNNLLSGTIPEEMNEMTSLRVLGLQREGSDSTPDNSAPDHKTVLGDGDAQSTSRGGAGGGLRGPLPAFDKLRHLEKLFLGSNRLTGTIPVNFLNNLKKKDENIIVDLFGNNLLGTVPSSLTQFDDMTIYLGGNKFEEVPEGLCSMSKWMDGGVGKFGCDAIMCPPEKFTVYGRQHSDDEICMDCPGDELSPFFGGYECRTPDELAGDGERDILHQLYTALNGDSWNQKENWLDPGVSFCEWEGIVCSSTDDGSDGSVLSIHLNDNGLSGTFPTKTYLLENLQFLSLGGNPDLTMDFNGIDNAANLIFLNLDRTELESLEGIEVLADQLIALHVGANKFDGTFPSEIFSLSNLEILYISNNAFDGLPSEIGGMQNLVELSASDCGIEGNIPKWIGNLSNLKELRLDFNKLTGALPTALESLPLLEHLDLSYQGPRDQSQALSGPLLSFASQPALTELFLLNNALEGPIPDDFLQSVPSGSSEVRVDLRVNRFTGTVPASLDKFQTMVLLVSGNEFVGIAPELCDNEDWNGGDVGSFQCDGIMCPIGTYNFIGAAAPDTPCVTCSYDSQPQVMGSMQCGANDQRNILEELFTQTNGEEWLDSTGWLEDQDFCSWKGIECGTTEDTKAFVTAIVLEDNNLSGVFPDIVFELGNLIELKIRGNPIEFSFSGVEKAQKLRTLHLSEIGLTNLDNVGKAKTVEFLHLTSNSISELPDDFFELPALREVFLNYNTLQGTVPTKIGQMTSLTHLYMFHNQLTGTLPTEIGDLSNLQVLALGENSLEGSLPSEIARLTNIEVFALQREVGPSAPGVGGPLNPDAGESGQGLSGSLPAFDTMPRLNELYLGSNRFVGSIPETFLKGVKNMTKPLRVDLTLNLLIGSLPESLERFEAMTIFAAGNLIDTVPDSLCEKSSWMDGEVGERGCDAILCPPDSFNEYGRHTSTSSCEECPFTYTTEYYGGLSCAADNAGAFTQREILGKLYEETGGRNWIISTNWMRDTVDICFWHGVRCEEKNGVDLVTEIHLSDNDLQGTVPPIIFKLPSVQVLDFSDNDVDFEFEGIGEARKLTELHLDSTAVKALEGLDSAKELRVLKLQQNDFGGGSIPDEIFELSNLRHLYLSESNFGGSLPTRVGDLTHLREFYCRGNELTGTIPEEVGSLSKLEVLSLSENRLYGSIPTSINNLSSLKALFITSLTRRSVGLSGKLPDFAKLKHLTEVYLSSNSLTGTIPTTLLVGVTNRTAKITIGLSSNRLSGTIPASLTRFDRLNIDVTDNRIVGIDGILCNMKHWMEGGVGRFECDAILCPPGTFNQHGRQATDEAPCRKCDVEEPSPFHGMTFCESEEKKEEKKILQQFYRNCGGENWKNQDGWMRDDIDICHWYGISCNEGRTIDSVLLGSNNIVGTPPSQIFEMRNLKWLWLYSNPIDFRFDGIGNAERLTSLLLDSTGLRSLAGVGEARSLVDLDVRFNRLKGSLPKELSKLNRLETFSCSDNSFSGQLPDFSNNLKLKNLRVGSNMFSGTMPDFASHVHLKSLDISGNRISGTIPPSLLSSSDVTQLIFVDLSDNRITGVVPADLSRFKNLDIYLRDNAIVGISPELCQQDHWNDGDVASFDCDGILCPQGTYSPEMGRASRQGTQCMPCDTADHFGTTSCDADGESGATMATIALSLLLAPASLVLMSLL